MTKPKEKLAIIFEVNDVPDYLEFLKRFYDKFRASGGTITLSMQSDTDTKVMESRKYNMTDIISWREKDKIKELVEFDDSVEYVVPMIDLTPDIRC